MKAIHSAAPIIIFARFLFAGFYIYLHLWGLTVCAISGGLVWIWIFLATKNGYRSLPFILCVFESVILSLLTIYSIGWNSGAYFLLILVLPFIMINAKFKKTIRNLLCFFVILLTSWLFITTHVLNLGITIPQFYENILFFLNLLTAAFVLVQTSYSIETEKVIAESEIFDTNKRLLALANTDPLTNLLNRRIMMSKIEKEKERVDLGGKPFSLIMIDVDDFKQINDEFGHDGGDFVLLKIAELIQMSVRSYDLISRWGGDEFLIMLYETDLANSETVAEKVRLRVINSPFVYREIDIPVTITLGVSLCDKYNGIGNSLRKADLALYKGKQEGKNKSIWG
jgi:diguanylate cyclase (GGDEF)-like protein